VITEEGLAVWWAVPVEMAEVLGGESIRQPRVRMTKWTFGTLAELIKSALLSTWAPINCAGRRNLAAAAETGAESVFTLPGPAASPQEQANYRPGVMEAIAKG
jgi:hypothetical protein